MKFLSISSLKDTVSTLTPAIRRQLMEATVDWINQQKQAGKILEVYFIPGWRRTMVIREAKTAEEVAETLATLPTGPFLDIEVYPLADFNESMKASIESAKKAEQLFPSAPK